MASPESPREGEVNLRRTTLFVYEGSCEAEMQLTEVGGDLAVLFALRNGRRRTAAIFFPESARALATRLLMMAAAAEEDGVLL